MRGEYASAGKTLVLVAVFMACGLRFEMGRDEVSKKKKKDGQGRARVYLRNRSNLFFSLNFFHLLLGSCSRVANRCRSGKA